MEFMMSSYFRRLFLGVDIGRITGYLYNYFAGCSSVSFANTGNQ